MPEFCDVALPVPLDMTFTYRIGIESTIDPVVGGRVLVPFRAERLSGIVTALHDNAPSMAAKSLYSVIDDAPVLSEQLLQLGKWIAQYYVAPIGEVLRTMLPLAAEVRRRWAYRTTALGEQRLFESAQRGSSKRSNLEIDDQMVEYAVLNHLSSGEQVLEGTLRSATGASRELLRGLMRKRWIVREDVTAVRDARRVIHYVVLDAEAAKEPGKLNANQKAIFEFLQQSEGRAALDIVRELAVPRTTLSTLVKRSLVHIDEEAADFLPASSGHHRSGSPLAFLLNPAQRGALASIEQAIQAKEFSVALLHGVTGSGKTAVYLSAMKAVLAAGRCSILLVPEIGLTPAAAANLHNIFGDEVAILHSGLSDDERAEQWHRIRRSEARVVVGTRSAVFAPVGDLALIIVDEEHDQSYKQGDTPRYHARDVAIMRGKIAGAAVVLGSATPALETYRNALINKYKLIEMRERVAARPLPEVEVIDMRTEAQQTGDQQQLFSRAMIAEATMRMERGEQVIILLNRRGYSAIALCRACGESMQCKNCAIALTHHRGKQDSLDRITGQRMECHYCGYRERVPERCPKCDSEHLFFLGAGSEKVEDRLQGIFPQARIGRLDRDTVKGRDDFEHMLNRLHSGEIDLLVGTQMIAKGHDIHGVTMVGVVGADNALAFPDFRAAERTFQLLTQVAGRAGRGDSPGKVILQTFNPDHYAIQFAAKHDFIGFYEKEMRFRRWMHYPPFTALANVLIRSDRLDHAMRWSSTLGYWISSQNLDGVRVLGPAAAPIVKLQRDYRYHFVMKSESRQKLNNVLRQMLQYAATQKIPRTGMIVDVDALSLM